MTTLLTGSLPDYDSSYLATPIDEEDAHEVECSHETASVSERGNLVCETCGNVMMDRGEMERAHMVAP